MEIAIKRIENELVKTRSTTGKPSYFQVEARVEYVAIFGTQIMEGTQYLGSIGDRTINEIKKEIEKELQNELNQ